MVTERNTRVASQLQEKIDFAAADIDGEAPAPALPINAPLSAAGSFAENSAAMMMINGAAAAADNSDPSGGAAVNPALSVKTSVKYVEAMAWNPLNENYISYSGYGW